MSRSTLAKAVGAVAFLTVASNVLGFLREASLEAVFGATSDMDAYLVDQTIPDLLRTTHVVRKEGSVPTSLGDGDETYEGTFPMVDHSDAELGKSYSYLIVVEDQDGLTSPGVVGEVRTDPSQTAEIRVYPESVSLEVGQKSWFFVRGYTAEDRQVEMIGSWGLQGDTGSLNYTEAMSVEFTATKEGTGFLEVRVGELTEQIPIRVGCPAPVI